MSDCAARAPQAVNPEATQTPPPFSEASEQETLELKGNLKDMRHNGSKHKPISNSESTQPGSRAPGGGSDRPRARSRGTFHEMYGQTKSNVDIAGLRN
jgi:hypothetical protein